MMPDMIKENTIINKMLPQSKFWKVTALKV